MVGRWVAFHALCNQTNSLRVYLRHLYNTRIFLLLVLAWPSAVLAGGLIGDIVNQSDRGFEPSSIDKLLEPQPAFPPGGINNIFPSSVGDSPLPASIYVFHLQPMLQKNNK